MKTTNRVAIFMTAALLLLLSQDTGAFVSNTDVTSSTTALFARDPQSMRVAEIKAELKELRVGFGDCFDKESLVTRLKFARANPPPPPRPAPAPASPPSTQTRRAARPSPWGDAPPSSPPRRAARPSPWGNPVEFGAESDMNSPIDMDVFAQAGWTGEEKNKGMSPVDHNRSPGLNRNFDELSTDDFKQSYRG